MKFSEYVVIESTGSSVDPLGYLRPSSAVADGLYRQFTVLSNHPAYLGFLSFAFQYLEARGKRPGVQGFSKDFRDLEVFWGIIHDRANVSILNVTKYAVIAKEPDISLRDVQKYAPLYDKLNYGTLGHYSSPAIFWGILDPKGIQLTELGRKLGHAWSVRGGLAFGTLLDAWLSKSSVAEIANFSRSVELFNLDSEPTSQEMDIWKKIIEAYCAKNPKIQLLWNKPVTEEIRALAYEESTYPSFFPAMLEYYKQFTDQGDLCERIDLAQQFEVLAALAQFIFEWEYVDRLDEVRAVALSAPGIKEAVANLLIQRSESYLLAPGHQDTRGLFRKISQARTCDDVVATVLTHHIEHQRSKGASPFLQGQEIIVQGRVNPMEFAAFVDNIKEKPIALERKITWRHHRNWHIERAAKWLDYAGGAK